MVHAPVAGSASMFCIICAIVTFAVNPGVVIDARFEMPLLYTPYHMGEVAFAQQ